MNKNIDAMVMENVLGIIEVEAQDVDDKRRYGFYIDSFYMTGMTLRQYYAWARTQSRFYGDLIFSSIY